MTGWLTNRRSLLLLFLVGAAFLWPLWTTGNIVYSAHSDIIAEHVGIKTIEREAVRTEGRFPLWNPSMNAGMPAFANPQSMYLFPFDLLFLVLPLGRATNLVIVLNFLLAGAAMFLFARRHLRHPAAALACGAAYMLSYRYVAMIYCGWLPKLSMFALTPLLFWACDLAFDRPSRRSTAAAAVVGALALLQGDMQQLYYASLACLLWVLLRLGRPRAGGALLRLALGGLLAAMLAAPALLPRLQFTSLSTRTEPSYEFLLAEAPRPADLATFFDPGQKDWTGAVRAEFWENNFYFGWWMAPLWVAAFCGKRRRPALLLTAGIALMVLLCFDTPVLRAVYEHFPGFALFRQSSRILLLAQFAAVLLAGLGADFLLGLAGLAGAGGTALAALLVLAPVADAGLRLRPLIRTAPLAQALPAQPYHAFLDRQDNQGRVLAVGRDPFLARAALLYSTAAYYGIDLVNGAAGLELRHYIEYFYVMEYGSIAAIPRHPAVWTDCLQISKPEMLRALDVRAVVGEPGLNVAALGAKQVWEGPRSRVYVFFQGILSMPLAVWRLDRPLGPAYFATSVHPVASEEASLQALVHSRSALEANVFGIGSAVRGLGYSGGTAGFLERGLDRYRYRVDSRGNNFLILSQVWFPDWKATLDGTPLRLYRTNHALLGCIIPAGHHELTLEMTSPALRHGAWLAAAAVIAVLLLLVL